MGQTAIAMWLRASDVRHLKVPVVKSGSVCPCPLPLGFQFYKRAQMTLRRAQKEFKKLLTTSASTEFRQGFSCSLCEARQNARTPHVAETLPRDLLWREDLLVWRTALSGTALPPYSNIFKICIWHRRHSSSSTTIYASRDGNLNQWYPGDILQVG